jgi:histone H3/H4
MAQLPEEEVKKGLEVLEQAAGAASGEPVITREQLERIRSIDKETDPVVKAQKTTEMMDSLLKEFEEGTVRLKELLKEAGLDEGAAVRFLEGDRVSQDARRDMKAAVERQVADVKSAAEAEARHALGAGHGAAEGSTPPPKGYIPV